MKLEKVKADGVGLTMQALTPTGAQPEMSIEYERSHGHFSHLDKHGSTPGSNFLMDLNEVGEGVGGRGGVDGAGPERIHIEQPSQQLT